jgi:hypothetical protein
MSMDLKDPMPAPTEVLIPEAREHQKRRYLWTGLMVTLAALVLAVLIGGAVILFSGSPAGSRAQRPAVSAAVARSTGYVYFRPVLCAAPDYSSGATPAPAAMPLSCSPTSELSGSNLAVTPKNSALGFSSNNVAPDSALAGVPSTSRSADAASVTVLLPATRNAFQYGGPRFVLGPAEMTNTSVSSASAHRNQTGQWVVDYTMKSAGGSARWDRVAQENFHQLLGIDFDGTVVSAPIIQPSQSSFSSFEGHGEITGNLTHSGAVALARALTSHRDAPPPPS